MDSGGAFFEGGDNQQCNLDISERTPEDRENEPGGLEAQYVAVIHDEVQRLVEDKLRCAGEGEYYPVLEITDPRD